MPPRCTVCSHPQRSEIDAAIIEGVSLRNIAAQFGVLSHTNIYRHQAHAHASLLAGITARNAALAEQLCTELEQMIGRELAKAQEHMLTLINGGAGWRVSAAQWQEALDGMFSGHVRIISYILRLLKNGAESPGPNSRARLIQGVSNLPEGSFLTLRRVR